MDALERRHHACDRVFGFIVERPQRSRCAAGIGAVLEGLRYIAREKLVLGAISLDLFAVLLGGAVALLPIYAKDILKIGAAGLGILRSGPGIGAEAADRRG